MWVTESIFYCDRRISKSFNKLRNSEYVIRNATLMHLPMHGHNKMQTMQTE